MYLGTNKEITRSLSLSLSLMSKLLYVSLNKFKQMPLLHVHLPFKAWNFLDICNEFWSNPFPLPFDSSTILPKTFPYQLDVPFVLENPVNLLSSAWIWITMKYTGVWVVAFHVPHPQRTLTLWPPIVNSCQ